MMNQLFKPAAQLPSRKTVRRGHYDRNRGVATVECVLCLPVIFAISFATIDLCSAMFLKESVTIAAYEGARVGIQRGGTNAVVTARITEVLDARGISYDAGVVSFGTPGFDTAGTLEHVTVTVTVPCQGNLLLTGAIFRGRTLSTSVTLRKEFGNL